MKQFFQANGAAIFAVGTILIFGLSYIRYWGKREKIDLDDHEKKIGG